MPSTAVQLPSERDYDEVANAFQGVYDDLEAIISRIEPFETGKDRPDFDLARPVTLADLGALWSFLDDLQSTKECVETEIEKLTRLLVDVRLAYLSGPRRNGR